MDNDKKKNMNKTWTTIENQKNNMKARENNWNPTNLDTVKQIVTHHSERGDIVANYKKPHRE